MNYLAEALEILNSIKEELTLSREEHPNIEELLGKIKSLSGRINDEAGAIIYGMSNVSDNKKLKTELIRFRKIMADNIINLKPELVKLDKSIKLLK